MTVHLQTRPLTAQAFAPFGDVLAATGAPDKLINQGKCAPNCHFRHRLGLAFEIYESIDVEPRVEPRLVERRRGRGAGKPELGLGVEGPDLQRDAGARL